LIAVNRLSNNVVVLTAHGDASFAAPKFVSVGSRPIGLEIADLNADGKPDFVAVNSGSNDVSSYLNGGSKH
jgi:hypothetical protein